MILLDKFKNLEPFTFGPENHKQFYKHQGKIYCLRKSCDLCKFKDTCKFTKDKLEIDSNPNVRRALAIENESFLILRPNVDIKDIPILTEDQRLAYYPYNLHFIKQSKKDKLFIIKGQVRYYGSLNDFNNSEYIKYFTYVKSYNPNSCIFSLDYSAIEPRLATLVIREPKWLEVFKGSQKIVAKEIEKPVFDYTEQANHILNIKDKHYCILLGELDKEEYHNQCNKCKFKDTCKVIKNYTRYVSGDWHSKNAEAFYRLDFIDQKDKNVRKAMRTDAKVAGLALIYGSYENTLARVLNCSIEKAKLLRDNFFAELSTVKRYMSIQRQESFKNKTVVNLFNRNYNIKFLVDNSKVEKKYKFKADNIALNHPIQSLGADFLKLGIIESQKYIKSNNLNIYSNIQLQNKIDILNESKVSIISNVHDEVVFIINDFYRDEIIPALYIQMRLDDLLDKFKAGFYLEMDVEFDKYRSWTATSRYETSKIFLLNELGYKTSSLQIEKPNIIIIELDSISEESLSKLISNKSSSGYLLGVVKDESVIYSSFYIDDLSILDSFKVNYKLAYIKV